MPDRLVVSAGCNFSFQKHTSGPRSKHGPFRLPGGVENANAARATHPLGQHR